MSVKKVMTFKSGKFAFSTHYSEIVLMPRLVEFRIVRQTISDLPILPSLSAQLESELLRRSIFSTAAIEGNPFNEEAVAHIIDAPDDHPGGGIREIEIRNLKRAYNLIQAITASDSTPFLNERWIQDLHAVIIRDIHPAYNIPGIYRNHPVQAGDKAHGGVYAPPKCLPDIQQLMQEYVAWLNSEELLSLDPIIRAALAHYYLGLIHPFSDGNGRTARLVEAALLRFSGMRYISVMLSNFYYRNIDEYFTTFSVTRKRKDYDVTPFVEFVLKACLDSLYEIQQSITSSLRKLTLRDYYGALRRDKRLTGRQHELLLCLVEQDENDSFALHDVLTRPPFRALYAKVSERTARRDVKKLTTLNLLQVKQGRYVLNWSVLDAL